MIMLFSQRVSLVLLAPTRSGMKLGHLCGHSCFSTCGQVQLPFKAACKNGSPTWTYTGC